MMTRKKLKIPKKIKIGYLTHKVVYGHIKSSKKEDYRLGETHSYKGIIKIAPANKTVEKETLLHEILHAALAVSGQTQFLTAKEEERIVSSLSPYIFQILRDNPILVSYLTESENEL